MSYYHSRFCLGTPLQKGIFTATKKVVLNQGIGNSDIKRDSVSEIDTINRFYKEKCLKPRNKYFNSFNQVFMKVPKITGFWQIYSTFVLWENVFLPLLQNQ